MTIKKSAENAVAQINKTLPTSLSDSEIKAITKIIEEQLVLTVKESTESCTSAAVICCGPESDLAHKMTEKLRETQNALIANLMSMR